MTKYFEVTAMHEDTLDILYGSFLRSECKEEIECERESWKDQGYKAIKIISRETTDTPDNEVYDLVTSKELWLQQAPCFNFELDEEELLEKALDNGYVTLAVRATTPDQDDLYLINEEY